ncbi:MAG: hypothetical protein LQ350_003638 [Teloschistes chrysophthalmus]|nr:MAG: hypothetical protein LQ350_003638 [Niorma chrysophthalma]
MGSSFSLPELKKPSFCRRKKKSSTQTSTFTQKNKITKYQISAPKNVDFRFSTFDHTRTIIIPSPRILLPSPDSPTESATESTISSASSSEPLITSLKSKSSTHLPLTSISYSEKTPIPSSTEPSSLRRPAPAISWSNPIASPTKTTFSSDHQQHPSTTTTTARSSRALAASPTTTTTTTKSPTTTRSSRTLLPSPTHSTLSTIPESEPNTSLPSPLTTTTSPAVLTNPFLTTPTTPTAPTTALTTTHKPYCYAHAQDHPPYLSCLEARQETRRRVEESILRRESIREKNAERSGEWDAENVESSGRGGEWDVAVFRQHRIRWEDEGGWWF